MYDELLRALRCDESDIADCWKCEYGKNTDRCDTAKMMLQAADIIEKLSKYSWISVKDRLPESGQHVLACCKYGNGAYVCCAFHTESMKEVCRFDCDAGAIYDEDTDEYYFPEGWWESVKNWDECTCVAIGDFVTHWMTLPGPPKEE